MKKIYTSTLLFLFISLLSFGQINTEGSEFWIDYHTNLGVGSLKLFIASPEGAKVEISNSHAAYSNQLNIEAGALQEVVLPAAAYLQVNGVSSNTFHIVSDSKIAVYGVNYNQYTTDAYVALPKESWGTEYRVATNTNFQHQISVIAGEDNTEVVVTDAAGNTLWGTTLMEGQVYYYTTATSLAGALVSSNNPVALFAGADCANLPGSSACDHLVEQLPPTQSFGQNFIVLPSGETNLGSGNADFVQIIANEDNTVVTSLTNGEFVLNAGDERYYQYTAAEQIVANKPILVIQYGRGTYNGNGTYGDPMMMVIPPQDQFLKGYIVGAPQGFQYHFLNIVVSEYSYTGITLDGVTIPESEFSEVGESGYYGARIQVSEGNHTIKSSMPFGVFSYGINDCNSYGFAGGMSLAPVASVDQLGISPAEQTVDVKVDGNVTATVLDSDGVPMEGILVNFYISGIGELQGGAYTDASGKAVYTYTRTDGGVDHIYAKVLNISSSTVTVNWYEAPRVPVIVTNDITDVDSVTATFNGTVTDVGHQDATQYGFCWGENEDPDFESEFSNLGAPAEGVNFSQTVTGLSTATQYYVRAYAINDLDTVFGGQKIFVTAMIDQKASAASNISCNSFTANWEKNSSATGYKLDISEFADFRTYLVGYENKLISSNDIVSEDVSELVNGKTYYYRVQGINSEYGLNSEYSTTFSVTIEDKTPPEMVCKDTVVYLDASGTASIDASFVDNGSNDDCGIASMSVSPNAFDCSDIPGVEFASDIVSQNTGANSAGLRSHWQSWTSTVNGSLNYISILHSYPNTTANTTMYLELYEGEGTDGRLIAEASNNNIVNSSTGKQYYVYGFDNVNIVSGKQYTWRVYYTTEQNIGWIYFSTTDVYAGGLGDGNADKDYKFNVNASTYYTPVILTVTDNNGNENTCSARVFVRDTIAPNVIVNNATVYLDAAGHVAIDSSYIDNGSSDACGIATMTLDVSEFDCSNFGENKVTLSVTDISGNSSLATASVTVLDTISPVAVCKPVTVYLDETGFASISEDSVDNGSADACAFTFDTDTTAFGCSDVFEPNIVTLTVTDASGNWSSCTSEVTVLDTISPIAACKTVTVYLDETGFASIAEDSVDNGSADACAFKFDTDTTEFGCSDVFETNLVTLTVTDASGNWSSCQSEVTVIDTISPVAVCQPITVYLDAAGFASIAENSVDNGSADACGISSYYTDTTEFDCSDVFEANLVTLKVTDASGNWSSCTAEVTVLNTIQPTVICKDITLHVGETGIAIIDSSLLDNGSYDVCGIANMSLSKTRFTGEDVGSNLVELSVADWSGNIASCVSVVTITDTVAPEVWCQDIGIVMNEDGTARIYPGFVLDSVFDAGGIASYNLDKSKFDCSNVGTNEVELIVTDFGGNTARCSANVEVYDNFAPVVLCNDLEVYLNEDGIAEVGVPMLEESSDDACGIAQKEISQSIFTDADLGDNTVNLYVIDVNGNVGSCESKVTVNDTIAPVVACNPISIWLSAGKSYQLTEEDVAALAAGSFDNATTFENLIIDVLPGTFECENIGDSIPVTVSVADKAGNQSSCETIVFVSYSAGKNLEDILVDLPAGVCETTVDYPAIFTGESCATLTLLDGLGADGVFPVGTTVETWEVALQGARDTVSFSVTVNSANAVPTLDPVADITASEDQQVVISLTGISDGGDCIAQELSISAAPDNTDLIKNTTLVYTSNESTAELELSLATNQTGEAQVVVRVTDEEGAFVTDTFMVFVQAGNHTPVLINPVADQEVEEGAALNLALSKVPGEVFTDSDGDELVWSFTVENDTVPAWMEVTETAGEFVFDFTPPTADTGCYNIIVAVEDPKGATATDTFELCVLRTITGIGNINEGLFAITMYPNPTTGKVYVENDSQSNENIAIIVFSASGSEVLRKEFRASDRIQFDLSDQVAGIYLVSIKQGEQQVVKKLILDRK